MKCNILWRSREREDLRVPALDLIGNGVSISQVSRLLKISRPTLYRWKQQLEEIGRAAPKKSVPPPQPSKIKDWDKFQDFVDINGDKTPKELAQLWKNVSHHTISIMLKKLEMTDKKKKIKEIKEIKKPYEYQEKCEKARCEFRKKLA
ncbi:MAG: helix-turn-helix domain-containing protein [Microcoleus sp. Co-bin12]|nr:helix-turn-helix domain-containing protein [Microcoleus sp. Co-bin12]